MEENFQPNFNITERIKLIADNEGIKITQLEDKIGASKGVLSRSLKNGTDIQSKWLTLLVENYPRYNAMWLLTGKGEMIQGKASPDSINNVLLSRIENLAAENALLKKEVTDLKVKKKYDETGRLSIASEP